MPNSTSAPNNTQINKVGFQFGVIALGQNTPKPEELEKTTTLKGEDSPYLQSNTVKVVEKEYIQLGANERVCKHCNTKFSFKHWNATYCGEKCKIEAWELRTGKTFNKKKKVGK